MFTLVLLVVIIVLIVWIWNRKGASFSTLMRYYLWIIPFIPLLSLVDHNLDHDQFKFGEPFHFVRVLPFYVIEICAFTSLYNSHRHHSRRSRLGLMGLFLAFYAILSLIQIPISAAEPVWSLFAWSWNVPGLLLFYLAGTATSRNELSQGRAAIYTVLGYIGINISLIVYGLITGRASDLFHTRNLGSVYASTAMLGFLMLYAGIAWVQARTSTRWSYILLTVSIVAALLTLSRTAVLTIAMLFSFVLTFRGQKKRQYVRVMGKVIITLGILFYLASTTGFAQRQIAVWGTRLGSFGSAFETRQEEFGASGKEALTAFPLAGVGFGNFYITSGTGYRDAHNLFVTEVYENGLLAILFLYVFIASGVLYALRLLFNRESIPVSASVLSFLIMAHTGGGVLSIRGPDQYYTTFFGWMLCFLIGHLSLRARYTASSLSSSRFRGNNFSRRLEEKTDITTTGRTSDLPKALKAVSSRGRNVILLP